MKPHLFRKQTRPVRYGIGDNYYVDHYQESLEFNIGTTWGENVTLEVKDIDRLIEVLQEIKGEVQKTRDESSG